MNAFCEREAALTNRSWTRGRERSSLAAELAALRTTPAIGTASGRRFSGSFSWRVATTSVFE